MKDDGKIIIEFECFGYGIYGHRKRKNKTLLGAECLEVVNNYEREGTVGCGEHMGLIQFVNQAQIGNTFAKLQLAGVCVKDRNVAGVLVHGENIVAIAHQEHVGSLWVHGGIDLLLEIVLSGLSPEVKVGVSSCGPLDEVSFE